MDIGEVRSLFPGTDKRVHLDAAGLSLPSTRAVDAIRRFLDLVTLDPNAAYHGQYAADARAEAARLIGARADQIALVPATSLGLNVVADAVPLRPGDNVVTTDLEFMSVVVPWLEKCRQTGAQLRVARHRAGHLAADTVLTQVDGRTRAVVLSSVQWTNGYRLDLDAIGAECQRRDVPLVVDAIQQLGALPLDVSATPIDYIVCGGHKWLASPSALGFAYASDHFVARHRPTLTYAPTAVPPLGSWHASWTEADYDPVRTYPLREDASRFEIGVHHAALGAAGLAGALSIFNEVGPAKVAAHVLALADRVAAGLQRLDREVVSPLERDARSGITTFRAGRTPADDLALRDYLESRNVGVSVRFTSGVGGVRVSTHVYNSTDDVDRLLDAVRAWLAGDRAK